MHAGAPLPKVTSAVRPSAPGQHDAEAESAPGGSQGKKRTHGAPHHPCPSVHLHRHYDAVWRLASEHPLLTRMHGLHASPGRHCGGIVQYACTLLHNRCSYFDSLYW